jgi:hypothetical protein
MALTKPHTLSDGTTIRVRSSRGLVGTELTEVPSRKRPVTSSILWMDGGMYFMLRGSMHRITHPEYSSATSEKEAVAKALAFYVESAEGCIAEAAKEGLPVEDMYGTA